MKRVLVYVISCNQHPYPELLKASLETWDSFDVPGVETYYYTAKGCPIMDNRVLEFPVGDRYDAMGYKDLAAYEWALSNLQWDYMARVNASCYVRKQRLFDRCQYLPERGLIMGVGAPHEGSTYLWGGAQFIISRDVVQAFVDNRQYWDHGPMEDVAMSKLAVRLGFQLNTKGSSCGINRLPDKWLCIGYANGGQYGFEMDDICEMRQAEDQYFIRVKQDLKRHLDVEIMRSLHLCHI